MLKIVCSKRDLNYARLAAVYEESISLSGKSAYSNLTKDRQILEAQLEFYSFLDDFFSHNESVYAVWSLDGSYVSALRAERYLDGYLIAGLETAPNARCKGFATLLLREVVVYLKQEGIAKIYSHVDRNNYPSLRVHEKCGFSRIMDHAVFLDGSVSHRTFTYCCKSEPHR